MLIGNGDGKWAVVELLTGKCYAGLIAESGKLFPDSLAIHIPAHEGADGNTVSAVNRLLNVDQIHEITLVPEETARELLDKPLSRHPAALHIPWRDNVARSMLGTPYRASGYNIVLSMFSGEEREIRVTGDDGKPLVRDGKVVTLIAPDVQSNRGKDKSQTVGMVVSHGPGEITYGGRYVSPEHDYACTLGDVVFMQPGSGFALEGQNGEEFRCITPNEIGMILRRDVASAWRTKQVQRVAARMRKYLYTENPTDTIAVRRAADAIGRPSYEDREGEHVEAGRSERTRTQVVVPAKPWEE